jgi:uncharacterized membrane protein
VDRSAERLLSAAAHAAIVFGFFGVGFAASLAITGIIWLYSKRSPEVRFHAEQAGCYQCSVVLINLVIVAFVAASGGFSFFRIVLQGESDYGASWVALLGLGLFVLWFCASILFGVYAAIMVLLGNPIKYPVIGNRAERVKRGT